MCIKRHDLCLHRASVTIINLSEQAIQTEPGRYYFNRKKKIDNLTKSALLLQFSLKRNKYISCIVFICENNLSVN